jgi:hypothetical protein
VSLVYKNLGELVYRGEELWDPLVG